MSTFDHPPWSIPLDIELECLGFSGSDLEPEDLEWLQTVGRKGLANSTFPYTTHQASFKSWSSPEPPRTDRHYRPMWKTPWTEPKAVEIWAKPTVEDITPFRERTKLSPPPIPRRPPTTLQHFPGELWEHLELALAEQRNRKRD